jgi:formate/nitrite transporter FocA (FNT family)
MEESKLRSDGKAAPDKIEPRKPADVIMKQQVEAGLGELHRSTMGLLITGLAAGLELGFSLFFMAVMLTYEQGALPRPIHEFLLAHMYTIGFIFVIVGRSELFTEHTTTAVMPVLHGQASIRQLARLWGLIYVANLVGEAIFSGIAVLAGPSLGVIDPNAFSVLASRVVNHSWWVILLSAILAGWLMGLLAWLVTAARDTISQARD